MRTLESYLSQFWGYDHFRPNQKEIITAVLDGKDTLALLPTGGGKSLCYQLPAVVQQGLTLVISPLIALMQDQVQQLKTRGIPAMALESEKPGLSLDKQLDNLTNGPYKLLFVSPERLQSPKVIDRLKNLPIKLIAVDEAHCVSEWGHDFRPAFLNIKKIRHWLTGVPILALTASATAAVAKDIEKQLALNQMTVYQSSFDRPNLSYHVEKTVDKFSALRFLLKQDSSPCIVYCRTRKQTEMLYTHLKQEGFRAGFFHGGLSEKEKKERLREWMDESTPIMIATMAFGMGIDKANVKQVIHLSPPESLENYYQETGRAGRDGKAARVTMLVSRSDFDQLKRQFLSQLPTSNDLKRFYKNLCNFLQIAYGEGYESTYYFDFTHFNQQYKWTPAKTLNCIKTLEKEGLWNWKSLSRSELQLAFLHPPQHVIQQTQLAAKSKLFEILARQYPNSIKRKETIELEVLSNISSLDQKQICLWLEEAQKDGWFDMDWVSSDSCIEWLHPREDNHTLAPFLSSIKKRNRQKEQKMNQMIAFCQNDSRCKRQQLLHYFGEHLATQCGNCSSLSCLKKENSQNESVADALQKFLNQGPSSTIDFVQKLPFKSEEIVVVLHRLAAAGKVKQNKNYQWEWTQTKL